MHYVSECFTPRNEFATQNAIRMVGSSFLPNDFTRYLFLFLGEAQNLTCEISKAASILEQML